MEINQNFLGLINKNNKQNSVLHVVQNYGELLEKKDISENKKKYIKRVIKKKNNLDFFYFSELNDDIFEATILLKPSIIHRNSTIDQAAKLAKTIYNATWDVSFSPKFKKSSMIVQLLLEKSSRIILTEKNS